MQEVDPEPDSEFDHCTCSNFEPRFKIQSPRMWNDQTSKFVHAKLLGSNSGSGSKEIQLWHSCERSSSISITERRTGAFFLFVYVKIMGSRNFAPGCFGLNKHVFVSFDANFAVIALNSMG